jgi:hypothetical protein
MFIPAIFDEDFVMLNHKNNIFFVEMHFVPSRVRVDSFDFASQKKLYGTNSSKQVYTNNFW